MTTLVLDIKEKIEYAKNFLSSFTFKIWKNRFDAYGVSLFSNIFIAINSIILIHV